MTSKADQNGNTPTKIKNIPYGVSDFASIKQRNDYFVDKTHFIPELEKTRYLFLIRPRRMGKSLWLSILANYYDIATKDQFEGLFSDTWIGQNPTSERNSYLVLRLDFSSVSSNPNNVEEHFNFCGEVAVHAFIEKYHEFFTEQLLERVQSREVLGDKLAIVFSHLGKHNVKLYIFIDEYDNFANTIMSSSADGTDAYRKFTHGSGFYRQFFNVLKAATATGAVERLFITGVSPITMDDVTSGFNIGDNISLSLAFQEVVGFTEVEVLEMLNYYHATGSLVGDVNEHLSIMRDWYNHYRFSSRTLTSVYNTDMVLYYIKAVLRERCIPETMIDHNIKIDYNKLRHLLLVDQQWSNASSLNGNFSLLRNVAQKERITSTIVSSFPLAELTAQENFLSLMYYFGLLTYSGETDMDEPVLRIPNLTVKTLMYGYLRDAFKDTNVFQVNIDRFSRLVKAMAYKGEWREVFDFLAEKIQEQTAIRAFLVGESLSSEKVIQGFLIAYLNIHDYFISSSEADLNMGFGDILLEPYLVRYPSIPNVYLLELKYIDRSKRSEAALQTTIENAKQDAIRQLDQYVQDAALQQRSEGLAIRKLAVVFHGWELVLCEEL